MIQRKTHKKRETIREETGKLKSIEHSEQN